LLVALTPQRAKLLWRPAAAGSTVGFLRFPPWSQKENPPVEKADHAQKQDLHQRRARRLSEEKRKRGDTFIISATGTPTGQAA